MAMSGGVDSSVAAALCVAHGLRTIGITLAMWPTSREAQRDRGCCSIDAVEDARRVAARLRVPHYVWNLEEDFHGEVIVAFEAEYAAARTPNPCVRCNEKIKFGALLSRARAVGASHLATGHYARRGRRGHSWTLHRARDARKDQAYTLHRLGQDQLARAVFPIGDLPDKAAVRGEAERLGLSTASKPDSQELCFLDGSLREELRRRLAGRFRPGPVVDGGGRIVGEHEGLPFYTVGQRSGLLLRPNRPDSPPHYVIDLDQERNAVVVGPVASLQRSCVELEEVRWISGETPAAALQCSAQFHAHGEATAVVAVPLPGGRSRLDCASPVRGVSPGQSAVLFAGDEVLGGGVIASSR